MDQKLPCQPGCLTQIACAVRATFGRPLDRKRNFLIDLWSLQKHDSRARYRRTSVEDDYFVSRSQVLGSGCSGEVVSATERYSKQRCAVKTYAKHGLSKSQAESLRSEATIHLELGSHPNIVELRAIYETSDALSVVTDLCGGGELFEKVVKSDGLDEEEARRLTRQMASAIDHLHQNQICHRDIKLENFLMDSSADDATVKLIDFGFSTLVSKEKRLVKACGTLAYMAPEVLETVYTEKCDLWSLGCTVFATLTGRLPFGARSQADLIEDIKAGIYAFKASELQYISAEARDFVERLLTVDPATRMSAAECLQHPWLAGVHDQTACACVCPRARASSVGSLSTTASSCEWQSHQ